MSSGKKPSFDYNSKYLSLNEDWHLEDTPRKFYEISQVLPLGEYETMLDIGCGVGVLTRLIADYYNCRNTVGLDISEIAVDEASALDKSGQIKWVKGSVFDLPVKKYDLVLCIDLIEHLDNIHKFLERLAILGKFIVIRVPMERTLLNTSLKLFFLGDEYRRLKEKYGHINHFTPTGFQALLKQYKLDILNKKAFPMPPRTSYLLELFRHLETPLINHVPDLTLRLFGGFLVVLVQPQHR